MKLFTQDSKNLEIEKINKEVKKEFKIRFKYYFIHSVEIYDSTLKAILKNNKYSDDVAYIIIENVYDKDLLALSPLTLKYIPKTEAPTPEKINYL